ARHANDAHAAPPILSAALARRRRIPAAANRRPLAHPALQRPPDGQGLQAMAPPVHPLAGPPHRLPQPLRRRVPVALAADRHAVGPQQAHAQHGGVGDDVDAGGAQARQGARGQARALQRVAGVALHGVQRLAGVAQHALGQVGQHAHGVAGDADVAERAVLVAHAAQLAHRAHHLRPAHELDVVAVHHVHVAGAQPRQAARHRPPQPPRRVVERREPQPPGFRDEEVRAARVRRGHGRVRERRAEERLRRAVVGGRVEGADPVREGAGDDGRRREDGRVRIVLAVEGAGAAD
ncbi:MAG: hypothetical protein LQ340_008138, partial [Diploschistes diacapsis]